MEHQLISSHNRYQRTSNRSSTTPPSLTIPRTSLPKRFSNATAKSAVQLLIIHKSLTPPIQTLRTNPDRIHANATRPTARIRPLVLPPPSSHTWIQIHTRQTGGRKNLASGMSKALARDELRIIQRMIRTHHRKGTTVSRTPIVRTIDGKGAVTAKRAMAVPVGRDTDIRAGSNMAPKVQGPWA